VRLDRPKNAAKLNILRVSLHLPFGHCHALTKGGKDAPYRLAEELMEWIGSDRSPVCLDCFSRINEGGESQYLELFSPVMGH
jgi:hypothetical protein